MPLEVLFIFGSVVIPSGSSGDAASSCFVVFVEMRGFVTCGESGQTQTNASFGLLHYLIIVQPGVYMPVCAVAMYCN